MKSQSSQVASGQYVKCYHSHPVLSIGGGTFIGGSCYDPAPTADIQIAFDGGCSMPTPFPWEEAHGPVRIYFPITDMSVPKNVADFKALVGYAKEQLALGKTIHAGCIGGHGRTGLFLAALLSVINTDGNLDTITQARAIYCHKAVESASQAKWLNDHFGVLIVKGAKEYDAGAQQSFSTGWGAAPQPTGKKTWPKAGATEFKPLSTMHVSKGGDAFKGASKTWAFVQAPECVWTALF